MFVFRRISVVAVVCLGSFSVAQLPDQLAASRVLGPHWRQIARVSGMIFSGTVLEMESQPAARGTPLPLVLTTFRVDRAIAGVRTGQILTAREWAGTESMQRPMARGQRLLIFLYRPSRLGLTSPVGGPNGQVALDNRGEIVPRAAAEQFAEEPARCRPTKEAAHDSGRLSVSTKGYADRKLSFTTNCDAGVDSTALEAQLKSCPLEDVGAANAGAAEFRSFGVHPQALRRLVTPPSFLFTGCTGMSQFTIRLAQLERAIRSARRNHSKE